MTRAQLALNVADTDQAVAFYTKRFATAPAKLHPGYANFAIADPPLTPGPTAGTERTCRGATLPAAASASCC